MMRGPQVQKNLSRILRHQSLRHSRAKVRGIFMVILYVNIMMWDAVII